MSDDALPPPPAPRDGGDEPPRPAGVPDPTAPRPPGAPGAVEVERRRRHRERAQQALVAPWSEERARRVRWIALVLIVLGPLIGTGSALLLVPNDPTDVFSTVAEDDDAVIAVKGTVRGIDPTTGEMTLRLVLGEVGETESDLFDGGLLTEDLVVRSNDATGNGRQLLPAGQALGTVTVVLDLSGSRTTRYPVDRYRSTLLLGIRTADDEDVQVPIRFELRANDPVFNLSLDDDVSPEGDVALQLGVERRLTVVGWAAFFVLVCWLLALAAASIGWTTVVRGITAPAWAWGFLIGVLFALPPLRNALPGSPPGGSLVDLAAFYWAVGIVAFTLVAMIGSWNVRVRRAPHSPDSPRP